MITRILIIIILFIFTSACESTSKINNLKLNISNLDNRIYKMERKIAKIENTLLRNQRNLKNELRTLRSHTEDEKRRVNRILKDIRKKTDLFTVRRNSNTLLFEPSQ